jgi:ABC-2 type transport system ATP-binding protein
MHALEIEGLTKRYSNGVEALKGIDLEVPEGDFFALLGPNGAGKTTAIGIITSSVKACIGVVPQEVNLNMFERNFNTLVNQAGYYGVPRKIANERAEKYLKELHLWEKRDDIARNLSGGMKRRLMIARALIHEPRLLILDEPTAGVDIEIRRSMWKFLREINAAGVTIILTTHYLEEAESLCRRVAIIDEGQIIKNDRISNVVRELQSEVFVLSLRDALESLPEIPGYSIRQRSEHELEVEVANGRGLNDLFAGLSRLSLEVVSMRTRSNRLEELFIKLVGDRRGAGRS